MVPRDLCRYRAAQTHQVDRGEFELETPPTGRDEDRLVIERRDVDDHREGTPRAKRADPADHVAGRSFGLRGLGHDRAMATGGGRQSLQVELAIDRDDGQDERAVDCCDERLEDPFGLDGEGRGGLDSVVRAVVTGSAVPLWEGIRVDPMDDPGSGHDLERAGRGGGHGPIVSISAMLGAAYQPSASIDAR
jgi:hypothetical protein